MNDLDRKEILYKEIDLIQNCITRMAQNSFMIKEWVITLVAACAAISTLNSGEWTALLIVGLGAIVIFWYLDAFFLKTERLYRYKYDWVIENRLNSNDYLFNLNPYNEKMWLSSHPKISIFSVMFSKTLAPVYIFLMMIDVLAIFI